jgi:uncharacterized membrane-anchored protein
MDTSLIPQQLFNNRKLLLASFLIVLVCLIIDVSISNISDLIQPELTTVYGISAYVVLSSVGLFGMFFMQRYVSNLSSKSGHFFGDSLYQNLLSIIFYAIIFFNIALIFQVVGFQNYNVNLLIIIITLSYGIAVILFGILSIRFFGWFKTRRSIVLVLYAAATAVMSFNMITSIIEFDAIIYHNESSGFYPTNSSVVMATTPVNFTIPFAPNSFEDTVSNSQFYSVDVYFVLAWLATGLFLFHYSKRIGRIKYWILISVIVFYYFYYYFSLWQGILPISALNETSIPIILINTYSLTTGGIIFGIGFFLMARSIKTDSSLRDYLIFCGIGLTLFFNSANATVFQNPYPPFGILNVSYVSLSSFFIFTGLNFAASSVSKDTELRRNIVKFTKDNFNPIANIGSAEDEVRIKEVILKTIDQNKETLEQTDGVSSSMTNQEVRELVDKVMQEVRNRKNIPAP